MFFKIFTLFIVSFVVLTSAGEESSPCVGCPQEHDSNDPEVHNKLSGILANANSPHRVKKIISVQKQVVAGLKYIVKFEDHDGKQCEASWVEQAWISKEPQYVKFNCP